MERDEFVWKSEADFFAARNERDRFAERVMYCIHG